MTPKNFDSKKYVKSCRSLRKLSDNAKPQYIYLSTTFIRDWKFVRLNCIFAVSNFVFDSTIPFVSF